ncbi:MAG: hypothetical protein CMN73_16930 [Sphingomonas sp.]|nr:hypothetical protein [Sphingomonas sp.]
MPTGSKAFDTPKGNLSARPAARLRTQPEDLVPAAARFTRYAVRRGLDELSNRAKAKEQDHLLHFCVHDPRGNAGDTVLYRAVREVLDSAAGPQNWVRRQLRRTTTIDDVRRMNETAKALVIGGGGLMMSETSRPTRSGWQWDISQEDLEQIDIPIIVYAVGYNQFRGSAPFRDGFNDHVEALVAKSAFLGLRNTGSQQRLQAHLPEALHDRVRFQPCPTTVLRKFHAGMKPDQYCEPRKELAVNLAFDRQEKRFDGMAETRLGRVAEALRWAADSGWKIKLALHGFEDDPAIPYLRKFDVPFEPVRLNLLDWRQIVDFYANMPLTIGMRGHAQMIPFGVGNAIISLISHDKLGFFLDDIGHPEWGIEMASEDLRDQLVGAIETFWNDPHARAQQTNAAQEKLWTTTRENAKLISAHLK